MFKVSIIWNLAFVSRPNWSGTLFLGAFFLTVLLLHLFLKTCIWEVKWYFIHYYRQFQFLIDKILSLTLSKCHISILFIWLSFISHNYWWNKIYTWAQLAFWIIWLVFVNIELAFMNSHGSPEITFGGENFHAFY